MLITRYFAEWGGGHRFGPAPESTLRDFQARDLSVLHDRGHYCDIDQRGDQAEDG